MRAVRPMRHGLPRRRRTLHLRDKILQLPESLLDDYNMKAKYRFDHFMIR